VEKKQPRPKPRYRENPAFEFESFAILGRQIGEDDARRLLTDFADEARYRLDDLRESLVKRDKITLGQTAQALNGLSAILGLALLASISQELQRLAEGDNFDRIDMLIQAAGAAFEGANPFIEEVLAAA
jgi:HPt (histidine-containing phosphotransfer) domain-containing protein